ncbi:hypothetical protein ANRL3_01867 [Anaerolineae bacterium]|nr:hypothetical protein ANRL3_01867 [Anaerolineae bacterium]
MEFKIEHTDNGTFIINKQYPLIATVHELKFADLLAAAPELLEACKLAHEILSGNNFWKDELAQIDAAIDIAIGFIRRKQ